MKKIFLFIVLITAIYTNVFANIDTVSIYSNAMHRAIKAVVVTPKNYNKKTQYPVVYLLHGAYGNFSNWVTKVPAIQTYATNTNCLVVCPNGANNSWYVDSPIDSNYKFETHVAIEVPTYIDSHYSTKKDRKYRAIAGLSMGGHGALLIAFKHSKTFGACGSMSGALNIADITKGYDVDKRLGKYEENKNLYTDNSVLHIIENYPTDSLAIIIDCGLQDFIIGMSKATHEKMVTLKIPHDYIERPGKHDWAYWANAIEYQMVFFRKFFNAN